ncbi:hypothetical protein [Nonomuraea sp. NPDC049625]|uniref:hypothetical protein n=1 Tax=Nonomuraea sp. NPDC049625 TaxID=3155775 RepID=UPI00341A0D22
MATKPARGRPNREPRIVAAPEPVSAGDQTAAEVEATASPAVTLASELTGTGGTALSPVSASPEPAGSQTPSDVFVEKMSRGAVPTLEDCERHITAITTQWLLAVGRALAAIRDHELFQEKGYTSFTAYIKAEHPWHPSYVSRVIADIPVVEALSEHGVDRDLNEGQATAVRPVLEMHGREALYEVWDSTQGKKSAAALVRVARAKGYLSTEHADEFAREGTAHSRNLARFRQFAELVSDGEGRRLIEAAKEDPDWGKGALLPALKQAVWMLESEFGDR